MLFKYHMKFLVSYVWNSVRCYRKPSKRKLVNLQNECICAQTYKTLFFPYLIADITIRVDINSIRLIIQPLVPNTLSVIDFVMCNGLYYLSDLPYDV